MAPAAGLATKNCNGMAPAAGLATLKFNADKPLAAFHQNGGAPQVVIVAYSAIGCRSISGGIRRAGRSDPYK